MTTTTETNQINQILSEKVNEIGLVKIITSYNEPKFNKKNLDMTIVDQEIETWFKTTYSSATSVVDKAFNFMNEVYYDENMLEEAGCNQDEIKELSDRCSRCDRIEIYKEYAAILMHNNGIRNIIFIYDVENHGDTLELKLSEYSMTRYIFGYEPEDPSQSNIPYIVHNYAMYNKDTVIATTSNLMEGILYKLRDMQK